MTRPATVGGAESGPTSPRCGVAKLEFARLATIDTLTGLPNRHRFGTDTAAHFASGAAAPCALFVLDLDNFKSVNDSLGHAGGDRLLQEVARRLSHVVEPGSLLARLGGDEFALFHPHPPPAEGIERYGSRLQAALEPPFRIDEHQIEVHASVGVAVAPADGGAADELLKAADMALHAAKSVKQRAPMFFDREMDRRARNRLTWLSDMREGLRRHEFYVMYQPQVDLQSGRLSGFEALARWRHPTRGLIAPSDFIPLAEESGLIVPLGASVLEQACVAASSWPSDLRVAVNVSAAQFAHSDVRHTVESSLRRSGLDPRRLELELTESALMHENDATLEALNALRYSGIGIAIDDFGTGYSSLSYLQQLPVDRIKIDRSFVRALDHPSSVTSAALTRTIAQLAQAMGFQTTAEGIETPRQCALLRQMGCTSGQGYLFGAPLDADETSDFLATFVATTGDAPGSSQRTFPLLGLETPTGPPQIWLDDVAQLGREPA